MDINELNKTQLILLTLLITFVVSIATGIVTVTLMNQMPKAATATINNVIQRTIEKVTTVSAPSSDSTLNLSDGSVLISVYNKDYTSPVVLSTDNGALVSPVAPLGQGVVISDSGLILIESSILVEKEDMYKAALGKDLFDAKLLKSFGNGFVVLQIQSKSKPADDVNPADSKPAEIPATDAINKQ